MLAVVVEDCGAGVEGGWRARLVVGEENEGGCFWRCLEGFHLCSSGCVWSVFGGCLFGGRRFSWWWFNISAGELWRRLSFDMGEGGGAAVTGLVGGARLYLDAIFFL